MMTPKIERGEMLLLAVSRLHRLQLEELNKLEIPLTLRQYRILERIDQGYVSMSELSKLSHRSLASTSESISGLIRNKLLTRKVSQSDRRTMVLSLTRTGERALAQGTACLDAIADNFFAQLTPAKQTALEQLSVRMYRYAGDLMEWESVDGR